MKPLAMMMGAAALLTAGAARAAVIDAQAGGFEIREAVQVAAPPETVWAAVVNVGGWWASSHTYSGSARNLTLEVKPGGCWCEAIPGGGDEHMRVINIQPPKVLRLSGALGPLQTTGGAGHLTFALEPKDGGTAVTVTYVFGGYQRGGFAALAAPVDGVLAEQVGRLKALAETGRAP